jgi:hypothetical protein
MNEVLYFRNNDAGLVDPNGVPLSTTEPFVMHGRAWRVVDVYVTEKLVRIMCAASVSSAQDLARTRPSGSAAS